MDGSPIVTAGTCITSLYQPAFAGTEGTLNDLMPFGMFRGNDAGAAPSGTIVVAGTLHHHQVLPISGSLYSIEVEQSSLAIIQQGGTGYIPIRHPEEKRSLFPVRLSRPQASTQDHHTTSIFLIGREPDSQ